MLTQAWLIDSVTMDSRLGVSSEWARFQKMSFVSFSRLSFVVREKLTGRAEDEMF